MNEDMTYASLMGVFQAEFNKNANKLVDDLWGSNSRYTSRTECEKMVGDFLAGSALFIYGALTTEKSNIYKAVQDGEMSDTEAQIRTAMLESYSRLWRFLSDAASSVKQSD